VRLSSYQRRNEAETVEQRTIKRRLSHGYKTRSSERNGMVGLVQCYDHLSLGPLGKGTGPGLVISEGPGKPGVAVIYNTRAEADAAAEKIREALATAVAVQGQGL
jgi:hypothetical protein